jgi:hypothetical protein
MPCQASLSKVIPPSGILLLVIMLSVILFVVILLYVLAVYNYTGFDFWLNLLRQVSCCVIMLSDIQLNIFLVNNLII